MYTTSSVAQQLLGLARLHFKTGRHYLGYNYFKIYEQELEKVEDPLDYLHLYLQGDVLVRRYMLPEGE